jgi:hypothetical protein
MTIENRVKVFTQLGEFLNTLSEEEFKSIAERAKIENPWFTESNLRMAVSNLSAYLEEKNLLQWVSSYPLAIHPSKTIALILAGNIPMVGFHDILCVLINGDTALIKISSKDKVLIKWLTEKIIQLDSSFADKIKYTEQLKDFDAVIATGSDNSSRYFDYYFGKYPHIIRKNRTSVAVLDGTESEGEMTRLGSDVFTYFGLGCRNVSKLFVPAGYKFDKLFESWESYFEVINHHKYFNNYTYQRTVLLLSNTPFLDNGFVLLQENEKLVSPISIVYYEYYNTTDELTEILTASQQKLQCIVGKIASAKIEFGQTQCPSLGDYADGVDTLGFLNKL